MRFSVRPFRRLHWQLSLSYTLVAAGALLVVELVLLSALMLFINSDALPRMMVTSFRGQFSGNLRLYLDRPQPDVKGLSDFMSSYIFQANRSAAQDTQVWSAQSSEQNMLVLGLDGKILWSQYAIANTVPGQPLDPGLIPGLARILPAAQSGDLDPGRLYAREGNLLVLAVPVDSADAPPRVLGVMVWMLNMPSFTSPAFLKQILPTMLISIVVFSVGSGLVGSIFGYFTARRLTRRLGRVSTAADAWSRGDFSSFITDAADDELGELARRLNAMAEQLQNLLHTRQDLAALEERNRIARELHDSVKQQVFATAMQLGAARALLPGDDSPAAQHLAEAERLTRQAQNELTALIRELRPIALEGKGLARALRELTGEWGRQNGITAQFDESNGSPAEPPLPILKEQALYRVAQEALSNVARHSQARSARVIFTRAGGLACLTVQDDGRGFDPRSVEGGLGLKSMRERVEALGGKLEIDSQIGKGTKLVVSVPVGEGR